MTILHSLLEFFDLRGWLLVALIFIPLERLLSLHHEQRVFRKWWWNDLLYIFVNRIFIFMGMVVIIVGVGVLGHWLVPVAVQEAIVGQPIWLQVIEVIILADLGFYAAHRMFHSIPWLWKFHAIHHSIEEMDWLAAARVHPLDQIVTKGMSLLPLYMLGFSDMSIGIFSGIYFWHSLLLHANVRISFGPLRWLVASPEFHHWHHANQREAYDKNFAGQLSILDKLFGTMHMPEGQRPAKFGVNDPVPNTFIPHLLYPFKARKAKKPAAAPAGGERVADLPEPGAVASSEF
jgi:sterol desaturase/sphingolipid hydroxylase (fatty acid hydroxylase superfamily)